MQGNHYTQKQLDHITKLTDKQIQTSINTLRRVLKRKSLTPEAKTEVQLYSRHLRAEQKSRLDTTTNTTTTTKE